MSHYPASSFVIIRGDSSKRIGDGFEVWETTFNIPDVPAGGPYPPVVSPLSESFLTYMVKGLTVATTNPEIRINNTVVGQIQRANGANRNHWYSQTVTIARGATISQIPGALQVGSNELEIRAVSYPGAHVDDLFDDFFLRNVILHYKIFMPLGFV